MATWIIDKTIDLQTPATSRVDGLEPQHVLSVVGDGHAHTWRVTVFDGGQPAVLTGSVVGYFIRSDDATVMVSGTLSGNVATVTLADACYAVEGPMVGLMRLERTDGAMTLAERRFLVRRGQTDTAVDPGNAFPSVLALNARLTTALSTVTDAVARVEAVSQYATTLTQEATLTLTADFEAYNASLTPRVSRAGAVVSMEGFVKNVSAGAIDSSPQVICYLPSWAWPRTDVSCIQQGSTYYIWWLRVNAADGSVTASRYRIGSGYPSVGVGAQFPLSCSWIAADAAVYADAISDAEQSLSDIVTDLIDEIGGSEFEQLRTSVIAIAASDTQQNTNISSITNQVNTNAQAITDLQNRTIADEHIVYEVVAMTSAEIATACQED